MVFFIFIAMVSQKFTDYLSNLIGSKIKSSQSVSGGDISSAYLVTTESEKLFLKTNFNANDLDMFLSEEKALKIIAETNTIAVPKVLACDTFSEYSFILMEYIDSKSPDNKDLELFGSLLAQLHQITSNYFGFVSNNFIGSLHQSNKKHNNWNDFYIEERLIPQLELANSKGLLKNSEIPKTKDMKDICLPYFHTC